MDFLTVLIVLAIIAVVIGVLLYKHGLTLAELEADVTSLLNHVRHTATPVAVPPVAQASPAPAPAPAQASPAPAPAPAADSPAPVAAPTSLGNAYIDRDDLMKAIGTGYTGGVMLDGVLVHNGFGPFDYFVTSAAGIVRGSKPVAAPAAPAPTDETAVPIGTA